VVVAVRRAQPGELAAMQEREGKKIEKI